MPRRALAELALTAAPFAALWLAMWLTLGVGYWLTLLLAVPTAGFLVRLFVIQHDCGHGSFFRARRANDRLGRIIGVLTLTPYAHWRHQHALHHGTSGNLDRRGEGDVETLTVREFRELPGWRRLLYRIFRHPLTILGLGPLVVFVLRQRLPENPRTASARAWRDVMASNLAIATVLIALTWLVGARNLLLVQLPITWLASAIGIWLFYVQHQFEHTYWEHDARWQLHAAGCMAARISTCRRYCAGSPPISGCTTSITCRPPSRAIVWARCCAITPSCVAPIGSRWAAACAAFALPLGRECQAAGEFSRGPRMTRCTSVDNFAHAFSLQEVEGASRPGLTGSTPKRNRLTACERGDEFE